MDPQRVQVRATDAIVIGLLMFAYCFPAPYVTIWPDTVRDFAASLLLARGEKIPLTGPGPINFGPYAGPAWIFLQAPPLLFSPTFAATSAWVAFVASLKFPALYELGRRLSGPRLGLCMAIAAAFPSFSVYQWIMFFHINWVEAMASVVMVLFLVADQRRSLPWLYGAVFMLGLAVQIHTTTLFYLPLAAWILYRIGVRGSRIAGHLAAMSILVLLWFAPVFFAPPAERGTLGGATGRIAAHASDFSPGNLLVALRTAFIDYPIEIGRTYGGAAQVPLWLWNAGLVVVGLAILGGMALRLRIREGRRLFLCGLAMLALAWTIGVAVRSYTSFYLVYFLLPLTALVIGLALESIVAAGSRGLRATGITATALIVVSLVVSAYGARAIGRAGLIESRIPAMGDLAHPGTVAVRAAYVGSSARDALAAEACALPGDTITLHGELAYALSISLGLDYRLHCPARADRFRVFGNAPGAHVTALPEGVVPALALAQDKPARGLRLLASVRPIHPAEGRPFEKGFSYFERLPDRKPVQRIVVEFVSKPGELLAVHRHKPFHTAWNGFKVTVEGQPAAPVYSTFNSWIYRTREGPGRWTVEVETDAPQWVEVFALGQVTP